ncbi:hypothetical protein Ahy_B03g068208 [Arachis hypogaea]|uniref:Uncharacterized protein n=1 Tax=Arachis hypogaea TaxID=3818 RepID=A0A445A8Y6_ARAHY|nr:hypothetical protein Ahy_B03g068208 [Arachis hypogaea]
MLRAPSRSLEKKGKRVARWFRRRDAGVADFQILCGKTVKGGRVLGRVNMVYAESFLDGVNMHWAIGPSPDIFDWVLADMLLMPYLEIQWSIQLVLVNPLTCREVSTPCSVAPMNSSFALDNQMTFGNSLIWKSEGLELFLLRLGEDKTPATFPPNILKIAESIAWECDGLPLAISVMARTMKGIHNIQQWRHALNKLGRLEMGTEMEEEVFKILKLSYDNLMDRCLQNCLLHCASYSDITRDNMIMKLVTSGAINGRSLREIYDDGHSILNQLQDHSLLSENKRYLRMQNSMRNMACHILKESQRCIVRCDQRLRETPHLQEWTADLDLVSLNKNLRVHHHSSLFII